MPSKPKVDEPDPVSEFVRVLITRWEESGKKLKDLAAISGLAKSMPSQIKARTSAATFYSVGKMAQALGYADTPDLVVAAYKWWTGDRASLPGSAAEAPQVEALRLVARYGLTADQIQRVLTRYPLPEYEHQDALWWLSKFHEVRKEDADKASTGRGEKHLEDWRERRTEKAQAKTRELKDRKDEAQARAMAASAKHVEKAPVSRRKKQQAS